MAYRVESVLYLRRWFLNIVLSFLIRKSNAKVLKTLTNFKILPVTLFKELAEGFRKPPVTLKLAPEPGCDSENCSVNRPCLVNLGRLFPCPMRGDHVEKTDQ
jgi:hypothetical protein